VNALLLLGPTGAGKTPLGDLLAARGIAESRCVHFDFGAELRRAVQHHGRAQLRFEEVDFLRRVLDEGALLEEGNFHIAESILRAFVAAESRSPDDLVILNGLPRHIGQARSLSEMLTVRAVVHLGCSGAVLLERIRSNSGGDRIDRADDSLDLILKKIEIFKERTLPLLRYYQERGAFILELAVDSSSTAEDLYAQAAGPLAAAAAGW
jgi:adenylate kinase